MPDPVRPMWEPCCPPFPIIEAALCEDPSMPGEDGFRLIAYRFDAPSTGLLTDHGQIESSPSVIHDSADSLSLICSRCGKAAIFTESPIEPKRFSVAYSAYGVGDNETEFQTIVTALDSQDAVRIIEACHKIRLRDYSIVLVP